MTTEAIILGTFANACILGYYLFRLYQVNFNGR